MKKFLLAAMLGAISLTAAAQTTGQDETVNVPGSMLKIELPAAPLHLSREETSPYRGGYSLSNGKVLHLRSFGHGSALYGEIDEEGMHKMVAASPNTFVAADRALKVTIKLIGDDDASGEVLIAQPRQRMADGSWSEAKVVSAAALR
ncbi:hypothetical protein LJR289_003163 [Pseudoduganella sp. LjRoot289]|uniref:hypothetical protein n=1 Tax=Pseudoduganella sp. LjRoot289 TaxID=3342314 RepID=UPI003ECE3F32